MSRTLSVSFESPQSGWMSLRLKSGARSFVAVASHAPDDSLAALMRALTALLSGNTKTATVTWNAEPEEFDFDFHVRGANVELRIVRFQGHRRERSSSRAVFSFEGALGEMCVAFWRELRELRARRETDVFEQNWRRPFPERELREFTSAVNSHTELARTPTKIP